MSTEANDIVRYKREMDKLDRQMRRFIEGYESDGRYIHGMRGAFALIWDQVPTMLQHAHQALTDAALVQNWQENVE